MKFLYDLKDRLSHEAGWQGYPKLGHDSLQGILVSVA